MGTPSPVRAGRVRRVRVPGGRVHDRRSGDARDPHRSGAALASGFVVGMRQELVDLSDEVWQRLRRRLDGLSDDEYLWEPAPGCWTIRLRADGSWHADWPIPRPDPEPLTSLAWRLWHLIDMY